MKVTIEVEGCVVPGCTRACSQTYTRGLCDKCHMEWAASPQCGAFIREGDRQFALFIEQQGAAAQKQVA